MDASPPVASAPRPAADEPLVYYVQSNSPNDWMKATSAQASAIQAALRAHDYSGRAVFYSAPALGEDREVGVGKDSRIVVLYNTKTDMVRRVTMSANQARMTRHRGAKKLAASKDELAEFLEAHTRGAVQSVDARLAAAEPTCMSPRCDKPARCVSRSTGLQFCGAECAQHVYVLGSLGPNE